MTIDSEYDKRLALGDELARVIVNGMPGAPKSFTEFYVIGLSMQFCSNLRALVILLRNRFDSEAWSIGRSMIEMLIKLKWVYQRKSHAYWIIVGTELADRGRVAKARTRFTTQALQAIDKRMLNYAKLPKRGRYWDGKRRKLRRLPTIECMAKECGMIQKYKGFFKLASDHLHSSHRVLGRFIETDKLGNMTIVSENPPGDNLAFSSHYLLSAAILFTDLLQKNGFSVDNKRFTDIGRSLHACRPPDL